MIIPKEIKKLHSVFTTAGKELFLVGGSVRDTIREIEPHDIDLVTDANPSEMELLLKGICTFDFTGKAFGVMRVFIHGGPPGGYEIATYRKDTTVGRRPIVNFHGVSMKEDADRRDFTINAMYMDIPTGKVIDFWDGKLHLLKTPVLIETPGKAINRFNEDRLRILRAIRFASRFNGVLSDNVKKAMLADSRLIGPDDKGNMVPIVQDRKSKEFISGVTTAIHYNTYLVGLHQYGLLTQIFQDIEIPYLNLDKEVSVNAAIFDVLKYHVAQCKLNKTEFSVKEYLLKMEFGPWSKVVDYMFSLIDFSSNDILDLYRKRKSLGIEDKDVLHAIPNDPRVSKFLAYKPITDAVKLMAEMGLTKGTPEFGEIVKKKEAYYFSYEQ